MVEAGYRVRLERLLRDSHLTTAPEDTRRMDLVAAPGARGVGAFRRAPLFANVTIVNPHTRTGQARLGASARDGGALSGIVAAKRRRYADVVAAPHATFLVLGCEAFGRWSEDAAALIRQLAALKALEAPALLQRPAQLAWANRWWALVSVGVQRAVAESLLRHGGVDLQPLPPETEPPALAELLVP